MKVETTSFETGLMELNAKSMQQLMDLYLSLHFIYPEKLKRLSPLMDKVLSNWEAAIRLQFPDFWVATVAENNHHILATGTAWQYSNTGMIGQHLASNNPVGSRIILLGTLKKIIENQHSGFLESFQIYYRPQNKYSQRLFETVSQKAGNKLSTILRYNYYEIPFRTATTNNAYKLVEITHSDHKGFQDFLLLHMGPIYIQTQELNSNDILLSQLNQKLGREGLYRKRRIFCALDRGSICGMIIINDSSLGLNFSFFENSCELILNRYESKDAQLQIAQILLQQASCLKQDGDLQQLLVLAHPFFDDILTKVDAVQIRNYNLFAILKGGYETWYDHVDELTMAVYQRLKQHEYGNVG